MASIAKWIRHNQGVVCSMVILALLSLWIFGCEAKVLSLIEPGMKVTREELTLEVAIEERRIEAELDQLVKKADIKFQKLDRYDEIKQKLINFAAITVDAGTVNPAGVVGLLFSIVGVGAVIDNRIKDKVIKNRPLKVT